MLDINNKWALVTGASRGIGKEIASALSTLGCNLVLHSRSVQHTNALAAELSDNGIRAVALEADLSVPAQVIKLIAEIEEAAPQIDILYNNAAIMTPYHDDIWSIPDEEFRQSFETNVISQIRLCNALIPSMMARRWGRVINLISGINEQPQLAPYAISKAALKKFTADFVPILKDSGVVMNSLDPGWLRTDMGSQQAPNSVDSVIPGALVPALLPYSVSGKEFCAQDYAGMSIEQALEKAESAHSLPR
ncbi:MAG: SDR family oxidoreductase [Gammaproteobacteria bacterium]|jgi:NAD(P)-dependent dehydrogenase (short-subunit alcohol dehydrogenase family)